MPQLFPPEIIENSVENDYAKNTNRKKTIRLLLYFILVLFLSCTIVCFFLFKKTSVAECNTKIEPDSFITFGSRNIWDTGAEQSLFFEEFIHPYSKTIVGIMPVIDYAFNFTMAKLYFSKSIQLSDNVEIRNVFYNVIDTATTLQNFNGIIGMNVINKANWLIDFSNNTIQSLSKHNSYTPKEKYKLCLSYKNSKRPKVNIIIQGVEIKDVVMDSGFKEGELILFKEDIEKINQISIPVDTSKFYSQGLRGNKIPEPLYIYDCVTINSVPIDSLKIIQSEHRRLIGLNFFKKFERIYLDTKTKRFYFY